MNRANYEDFDSVKNMMSLYTELEDWAHWDSFGDRVSASIFLDMRTAIYAEGVLTVKQREVVELMCYYRFTQCMVAEYLRRDRTSVRDRFNGAVKNIQKALLSGKLFPCNTPLSAYIPYCNYRGRIDRWMKQRSG